MPDDCPPRKRLLKRLSSEIPPLDFDNIDLSVEATYTAGSEVPPEFADVVLVPERPAGWKPTDTVQPFNGMAVVLNHSSKTLRVLATQLTEKIKIFEDWLNSLEGKIEAETRYTTDGVDPVFFTVLRLSRSGKRWVIEVGRGELARPAMVFTPLVDADIETKMKAVVHFRDFIDEIVKAQVARVHALQAVNQEFDDFAKMLNLKTEGK